MEYLAVSYIVAKILNANIKIFILWTNDGSASLSYYFMSHCVADWKMSEAFP